MDELHHRDAASSQDAVAVLGNCQSHGIARSIGAMTGRRTDDFHVGELEKRSKEEQSQLADRLSSYRWVFLQPQERENLGPLRSSVLIERLPRVTLYPAVSFGGFFPDSVYARTAEGAVPSPVGAYSSGFVIASYLAGVEPSRVPALMNRLFMQAAGYFGRYATDRKFLVKVGQESGYELGPVIDQLAAEGPFMHTHNHPKISILASIARLALAKSDLDFDPTPSIEIEDNLALNVQWPMLGPVAKALNLPVPSEFVFRGAARKDGSRVEFELGQFVEESYEQLSRANGALVLDPRTQRTLDFIRSANVR